MPSAGSGAQGETPSREAAAGARKQQRDVHPGSQRLRAPPASSRSLAERDDFSSLRFPEKFWKMVESDRFRSVWWSQGGKCVAIDEGLFKEEVLAGGSPLRVFATQNMKSFIRQLQKYGFTKVHPDTPGSASLPEFLAEEAAASAHRQILHYYNPSFCRDQPQLLASCKRKAVLKRRAPASLGMDSGQPPTGPDPAPQASPPQLNAPTMRQQDEAAPGPDSTQASPLAAALALPERDRAAGSESHPSLALFFLPAPSSQTPGGLQHPAQPTPWVAMPLAAAAASALLGPRPLHSQSPGVPHCPTCSCCPSPDEQCPW